MLRLIPVLLAMLLDPASPACAEEPLFLRIRPNAPDEIGVADADRARAARDAVWERSEHRAHLAIASVCTGCIKPIPPPAAVAPLPDFAEMPSSDLVADNR